MSAPSQAPALAAALPMASPWSVFHALNGERRYDVDLLNATRKNELQQAIDIVGASRVAIIYAPSGNGKSSIINAGIVPHFISSGYAIFRTRPRPPFAQKSPSNAFKACMLRDPILPERRPTLAGDLELALQNLEELPEAKRKSLKELAKRLESELLRPMTVSEARGNYVEALRRFSEHSLSDFIGETQRYLGPHVQMLFVCDQFEELFVHFNNTRELREFIEQVGSVYRNPEVRAQFLFSMREDLVGKMIEFRRHIPDVFSYSYRLPPLAAEYAPEAIALPARQQGVPVAQALVDTVKSDLTAYYETEVQTIEFVQDARLPREQKYIELPAIQVVMSTLWRDGSGALSLEQYAKSAKDGATPAASILRGYLTEALQRIEKAAGAEPARISDIRRDVLYSLTDGRFYRRALGRKQLFESVLGFYPRQIDPVPVSLEELDRALDPLIKEGIVLVDETGDGPQYELAHDFLVRSVVACWQTQDRRRAAAIGRMERARELERKQVATTGRWSFIFFASAIFLLLVGYLAGINPILPNDHDYYSYSYYPSRLTADFYVKYRPDLVGKWHAITFLPYALFMLAGSSCALLARYWRAAVAGAGISVAAMVFLIAPLLENMNRDGHWGWRLGFGIATAIPAGLVFANVRSSLRWVRFFVAEVLDVALLALWYIAWFGPNSRDTSFIEALGTNPLIIFLVVSAPFLAPVVLRSESFGYRLVGLRHFLVRDGSQPGRWRLLLRVSLKFLVYGMLTLATVYLLSEFYRYRPESPSLAQEAALGLVLLGLDASLDARLARKKERASYIDHLLRINYSLGDEKSAIETTTGVQPRVPESASVGSTVSKSSSVDPAPDWPH